MLGADATGESDEGDATWTSLRLLTFFMYGPFSSNPSLLFKAQCINGKGEDDADNEEKKPGRSPGTYGRGTQRRIEKARKKGMKRGREDDDDDEDSDEDLDEQLKANMKELKATMHGHLAGLNYQNAMQQYNVQKQNLRDIYDLTSVGPEKEAAKKDFLAFCNNPELMPKKADFDN